jgi:hypothetical protein
MTRLISVAALLFLCHLGQVPTASAAGIVCREDYQLVQGNLIATPYCGDNYLAKVARTYGMRVSNAEIRNNPNRKREVCRFIGHDIRVSQICAGETGRSRRGF